MADAERMELPKKFSDFIKHIKYIILFSFLFSGLLVYYLGFIVRPDYVSDFASIALLNAYDTYTTYFGLKYLPNIAELNPIQRESFEKQGYIKPYLKGLIYLLFLLSVLYLSTLIVYKDITLYSFGILALYFMVGLQPFLNLIIICKLWTSRHKV